MTIIPPIGDEKVRDLMTSAAYGDQAETAVYRAFERLVGTDGNWKVLWSVGVGGRGREADFIAATPDRGMALIEVKSRVIYPVSDQKWNEVDLETGRETRYEDQSPHAQLSEVTRIIKDDLENQYGFEHNLPNIVRIIVLTNVGDPILREYCPNVERKNIEISSRWDLNFSLIDIPMSPPCYIVTKEYVPILPAIIESVLNREYRHHPGFSGPTAEERLWREVIDRLARNTATRQIKAANKKTRGDYSRGRHKPYSHPVYDERGPDGPSPKKKRLDGRSGIAVVIIAALLAGALAWQWMAKDRAPATHQAETAVKERMPATKEEKDTPRSEEPRKAEKSPARKAAQSAVTAPTVQPTTDAKGRECFIQKLPAVIEGQEVSVWQKLCRIEGALRPVKD